MNNFLIQKIIKELNLEDGFIEEIGFNSLADKNKLTRKVAAKILGVDYISSKEEFEKDWLADYLKLDGENEIQFQYRLSKLNENRFIVATNINTQTKTLFVVDPTKEDLNLYLDMNYGIIELDAYKDITGFTSSDLTLSFDENEPMPLFIKKLFRYCYEEKATDIDLVSMQASISIKLKISGEWTPQIGRIPIVFKNNFLTALCSMASPKAIDYKAGKELKFRVISTIEGVDISFRVSVLPTAFGEGVALRRLSGVGAFPKLDELGLSKDSQKIIFKFIKQIDLPKKGGLVLITGETGSGKSTLLSAIENEYLKKQKKTCTSEDPVENKLPHPFLNQTEVGEDTGLTHMKALEIFLRQNADVIVIGECRKTEELIAVINAGLSGHYTYSTMHTGSVEDTFLRLMAMDVDLNMLAGTLRGIVSMSLIPKLCDNCKTKTQNGNYKRNHNGCEVCKKKGVLGVVPIIECALFTEETKVLIGNKNPSEIINKIRHNQEEYLSMKSQLAYLKNSGFIDDGM
jgi:type II secretory ATPase GspE/PulE/Tfp pilus assembly ATPase PilB-like protein